MAKEHRPNTTTPPDEESVFSKLMNTRVAQEDRRPSGQVAAVIVFATDVTLTDAHEILNTISARLESTDVQEFKPEYGRPVLYYV